MARQVCADILRGKDDRLVVIVGPCSIHDIDAGIEYCKQLSMDNVTNIFLWLCY